jgi:hypothetical protein
MKEANCPSIMQMQRPLFGLVMLTCKKHNAPCVQDEESDACLYVGYSQLHMLCVSIRHNPSSGVC